MVDPKTKQLFDKLRRNVIRVEKNKNVMILTDEELQRFNRSIGKMKANRNRSY